MTLYAGRWNEELHQPVPSRGWLTEDEARARYEAKVLPWPHEAPEAVRLERARAANAELNVVEERWVDDQRYAPLEVFRKHPNYRDEHGVLCPRWGMGFSRTGVRVQFYDNWGSVLQSVDYDARVLDGTPGGLQVRSIRNAGFDASKVRLWRWITTYYTYPDTERYYRQSERVSMVTAEFEPDGTGTVEFDIKSESMGHRARMSDAPVDRMWVDWPVFGQWDALADPNLGMPDTPDSPFAKLRQP